mmetsp:Transcript_23307/g.92439  ORF Transcript_23307/g.92439 Transcript_23307/m.92439 type:complete len:83 (+) Transcript_23307:117-365(+)
MEVEGFGRTRAKLVLGTSRREDRQSRRGKEWALAVVWPRGPLVVLGDDDNEGPRSSSSDDDDAAVTGVAPGEEARPRMAAYE